MDTKGRTVSIKNLIRRIPLGSIAVSKTEPPAFWVYAKPHFLTTTSVLFASLFKAFALEPFSFPLNLYSNIARWFDILRQRLYNVFRIRKKIIRRLFWPCEWVFLPVEWHCNFPKFAAQRAFGKAVEGQKKCGQIRRLARMKEELILS